MGTSVEGRDQAVLWEVALGWFAGCLPFALQIYPLPFPIPSSTSEVDLDCSQGFSCLLTSRWVQLVGSPSWSLEEGRREKLRCLFPQLPAIPWVYHRLFVSLKPRLLDLCNGVSCGSASGCQYPSLSMTFPLPALGETRKGCY